MPDIFGFSTPEETQATQLAEMIQMMSQAAPGVGPAVLAGQGVGKAAAGALGFGDASLERARRLEDAKAAVATMDVGSSEYIPAVQRELIKRGLFSEAQTVAARGLEFQKQAIEVGLKRQAFEKNQQEMARIQALPEDERLVEMEVRDRSPEEQRAFQRTAGWLKRNGIKVNRQNLFDGVRILLDAGRAGVRNTEINQFGSRSSTDTGEAALRARFLGQGSQAAQSVQAPQAPVIAPRASAPAVSQLGSRQASVAPEASQGASRLALLPDGAVDVKNSASPPDPYDAYKIAGNAHVVTFSYPGGPDAFARDNGMGFQTVMTMQKQAKEAIGAVAGQAEIINQMVALVEESGPQFHSILGRWVEAVKQASAGSDNFISSAANIASAFAKVTNDETMTPKQASLLRKVSTLTNKAMLLTVKQFNLGVLSGPDERVARTQGFSPIMEMFRRDGTDAMLDSAAFHYMQTAGAIRNIVKDSGLINQEIVAPTKLMALSAAVPKEHIAEFKEFYKMLDKFDKKKALAAEASRVSDQFGIRPKASQIKLLYGMDEFEGVGRASSSSARPANTNANEVVDVGVKPFPTPPPPPKTLGQKVLEGAQLFLGQ